MKKLATLSMIAAAGLAVAACGKPAADNLAASNEEVVYNEEAPSDFNSVDVPLPGNDGDVAGNVSNTSGT